ncbi:hypothetical protein KL86PLE_70003 [uncultured Pleomorphomonas sp.]|uniref:Uncharacterized protein n=1 Tax=uncultured Pleomorphomonas sp. TaxID=442121 RepID=A0A212LL19_9HYPH|nr:hypothetical protein KL86PLE_70003 [uncultured Pleomorphomonas sp.]
MARAFGVLASSIVSRRGNKLRPKRRRVGGKTMKVFDDLVAFGGAYGHPNGTHAEIMIRSRL